MYPASPRPFQPSRRKLILAALGMPGYWAATAFAQGAPMGTAIGWPAKPVKLVVPYAAGAAADMLARALGDRLSQMLGQAVIIDNKAGAGGTIGADYVAKAAPDGYTLVLGTDATHATNMFLAKKFPYDAVKDFTPITPVAQNRIVLVAHPSLPVKNMAELIAYALKNPRKLSFGSSGTGSAHHLAGELLNELAGLDLMHVAYKGGGPAMTDLIGGQIPLVFASLPTARPHIASGKVRALGFVEPTRFTPMPEVPTIGETVKGYAINSWFALFAPAGLNLQLSAKLNDDVNKALALPALRTVLETAGLSPTGGKAEDLTAFVRAEMAQRAKLLKAAGIEPE